MGPAFASGLGAKLQHDMAQLVEQLKTTIPSTLELEEHQNRIQEIEQEAKERHNRAFKELADRALERGIQLVRTPGGYAMAPVRNGEVIGPEEYEKLTLEERQQIEDAVKELQEELKEVVERIPRWRMRNAQQDQGIESPGHAAGDWASVVETAAGLRRSTPRAGLLQRLGERRHRTLGGISAAGRDAAEHPGHADVKPAELPALPRSICWSTTARPREPRSSRRTTPAIRT